MKLITTTNPATGKVEKVFQPLSSGEVEARLQSSAKAFEHYRKTSMADRKKWCLELAHILETRKETLGKLISVEMGRPFRLAVDEISKCAWNCRYFADHAERFLAEETVDAPPAMVRVRYEPLGAILAVMPWNYPFWQLFRFAAPALMAGNVILLKHASNVPQCALVMEGLVRDAGFPEGVFHTLLVGSSEVSALIQDRRIAAVTLTGSVEAGSLVAQACGKAVKKAVLELGGSDPFIVMPSADLKKAIQSAVEARMVNGGQSCIAGKRMVVAESIADEFEKGVVQAMGALSVGDPMDPNTQVGPLATEKVLLDLDRQVKRTLELGARLLLGGRRLDRAGYFYAPTVLSRIPKGSPAEQEEVFGPVLSIFRAKDLPDAIRIANDTSFGLGASVWTQDEKEQSQFVCDIQAGCVFINQKVASDPRLPFGGTRLSGYGRELGIWGIREFVNIKTVSIV